MHYFHEQTKATKGPIQLPTAKLICSLPGPAETPEVMMFHFVC